jgi:hypothetical protein
MPIKPEDTAMNAKVMNFKREGLPSMKAQWMRHVWPLLAPFFTPLGSSLFGAVSYGLWTFAVNVSAGGYFIATRSGLIHACMSFCITYSSVLIMPAVFKRARTPLQGALLGATTTLLLTYLLLISVHLYIGTPHILWTLAPGLLPTIGFDSVYSAILYKCAISKLNHASGDCSEKS